LQPIARSSDLIAQEELPLLPLPLPVLKDVVRLDILEAVRPALLRRFLVAFGAPVAYHGVAITVDRAVGVAGFYEALGQVDSSVPSALKQALVAIGDLANDGGHDHVLATARAHGVDLAADLTERQLNPSELAFAVYLDHRTIFEAAHLRVESSGVRRFVDFRGGGARLDLQLAMARRGQLADELGAWFAARNRTSFCDVRVCDGADEISLLVIHGRPPRAQGVIDGSGAGRELLAYVPDKQDLIIFRKVTGVLSVNAQFPAEQDYYRRAFGRVFFGDEGRFAATEVYTGAPVVECGALALSAQGIPRLSRVRLREARIEMAGPDGLFFVVGTKNDLGPRVDAPYFRCYLENGRVSYLKLAFDIAGRRRPLMVTIAPPNRLVFDRRVAADADVVHEFLLTRGFALVDATVSRACAMTDERMGA
jgi:hypothetical protein